jgi:ketosteroid isomerase-like protein
MPNENVEIVHRACAAFNRGDVEGTLADVDADFEYVTAGTIPDLSGTYRGIDRFKSFIRAFWDEFDEARLDVHEVVEHDDAVMVSMTMSGRGRRSAAETSWDVFQVWMLRDGKALRAQAFMSRTEALAALQRTNAPVVE